MSEGKKLSVAELADELVDLFEPELSDDKKRRAFHNKVDEVCSADETKRRREKLDASQNRTRGDDATTPRRRGILDYLGRVLASRSQRRTR